MERSEILQAQEHMAELLCALSYASSLGIGGRMEHGLKTAYIGLRLAEKMELPTAVREAVFYGALLKDVGCTACAVGFAPFFFDNELAPKMDLMLVDTTRISEVMAWFSKNAPFDSQFPTRMVKLLSFAAQCSPLIKESMVGHCEIAEMFARRLGFAKHVQDTVRYQWERWDGKGIAYHLQGGAIPIASRILHMAQMGELVCNFGGKAAAKTLTKEQRGRRLDPDVADAFNEWIESPGLAEEIEEKGMADQILALKPPISISAMESDADPVDQVCEALADFIDIKCKLTYRHSRHVTTVAEGIGRGLGQTAAFLQHIRRAALVHDIGKVSVPYGTLRKAKEGRQLTDEETDFIRLHSYYTQRILERVAPLRDLAEDASSHHEWVNGQGYHRKLTGSQIPLGGRVMALADAYTNLVHIDGTESSPQVDPEVALRELQPFIGTQFDAECYDALCRFVLGSKRVQPHNQTIREANVGGLTDREMEVLRLVAQGKKNPEIAKLLYISRKTVEHHLSHIYNKLGVSCRTSAVAYAMQRQDFNISK